MLAVNKRTYRDALELFQMYTAIQHDLAEGLLLTAYEPGSLEDKALQEQFDKNEEALDKIVDFLYSVIDLLPEEATE